MLKKKMAHILGIGAIVLGTMSGVGAAVVASQSTNAVTSSVVVADKADSKPRVINIHKYATLAGFKGNPDRSSLTGTEDDANTFSHETITPLAGVTFQVQKMELRDDLTPEEKKDASNVNNYKEISDWTPMTATTNTSGTATITVGNGSVADGYYKVTEISSVTAGKSIEDFIIALPFITKDGPETSIHVYPKNQEDISKTRLNPEKSFEGGQSAISIKEGADVSWKLTVTKPANAKVTFKDEHGKDVTQYGKQLIFSDPIDTTTLLYKGVSDVAIVTNPGNQVVPLNKEDYTVSTSEKTVEDKESESGKKTYTVVQIALTDTGLASFGDAADRAALVATITTTVKKGAADGRIINTFDSFWTGATTDEPTHETTVPKDGKPQDPDHGKVDPENPEVPEKGDDKTDNDKLPVIKMGNITVKKVSEKNENEGLANAKFKLFTLKDGKKIEDIKSIEDVDADQWVTDADNNQIEVTTDADGMGYFNGLLVDPKSGEKVYYLMETEAPFGYDIDSQAHEVTAKDDETKTATVVDPDNILPNLPMTGSQGRILVMAIASGLLIISGIIILVRKRREDDDEVAA